MCGTYPDRVVAPPLYRSHLFSCRMPDMKPNARIMSKFTFVPNKAGKKTLTIDFDCSAFRDIKGWCTFDVEP